MKNFLGIILATLLILASASVSFAEVLQISGLNVISTVEGVGFHDVQGYPLETEGRIEAENVYSNVLDVGFSDNGLNPAHLGRLEKENAGTGQVVCLRKNEWLKYDISNLKPGTFNFTVSYASTGTINLSFAVDDVTVLSSVSVPASGSYTNYKNTVIGNLVIPDGARYLTITQLSGTAYIDYFSFFQILPLTCTYDTNTGMTSGHTSAGADCLTFKFNNKLSSFAQENITVSDERQNSLGFEYEYDSATATVIVALTDALDYNSEYKVSFTNIKDIYGQAYSGGDINILTNGTSDTSGSASLSEVKAVRQDNIFTLSGTVKQSGGYGICGRKVNISVKAPESSTYVVAASTVTVSRGTFNCTYTLPDNAVSGKYNFMVESDFASAVYANAFFYDAALNTQISMELSHKTSVDDFVSTFSIYSDYIGFNMTEINSEFSDNLVIFSSLLNRSFSNVEEIVSEIKLNIGFERLNNCNTSNELIDFLNDSDKCSDLGINNVKWNELTSNQKNSTAATLYSGIRYNKIDLFKNSFDSIVTSCIMNNLGMSVPEISSTTKRLYAGGKSDLVKVSFNSVQNYVEKIVLELTYSSADFCDAVTIDSLVTNAEINKNVSANKINVIVTPNNKAAGMNLSDIISLSVSPSESLLGTYRPVINVIVVYSLTSSNYTDYTLDISANVVSSPEFNILSAKDIEYDNNYVSELNIEAEDVISNVLNVGFFDNGQNPAHLGLLEKERVGTGQVVCLRSNEWLKYDISNLKPGKYKFIVSGASVGSVRLDFAIDDIPLISKAAISPTGSYSTYAETKAGTCQVPICPQTLKITNSGSALYIDYIKIIRIDKIKCNSYNTNTGITNDITSAGADTITVEFNNDLVGVTEDNIKLIDSASHDISYTFSYNSKIITVNILEALKNNMTYSLIFSGLTDVDNQTIDSDIICSFTTADAAIKDGTSSFYNVELKKADRMISISGVMLQSKGYEISGRNVYVSIKSPGANSYELANTSISQEEGIFSAEFSLPQNTVSGKYFVKIWGDYVFDSNVVIKEIYYFDNSVNSEACSAVSNKTTVNSFISAFMAYSAYADLNLTSLSTELNDTDKVISPYLNKSFSSFEDVISSLKADIVREKINQALSASDVRSVISNADMCTDLGIDKENVAQLSSEELNNIAAIVYAANKFTDSKDCSKYVNRLVTQVLLSGYSVNIPAVTATNSNVNVGALAKTTLSFTQAQKYIKNISVTLSYMPDEAKLLKNNDEASFVSLIDNSKITRKYSDNSIIYTITPDEVLSSASITDIARLSFTAISGTRGTYSPELSVKVNYRPGNIIAASADIISSPVFTVTETTSGKKGDYMGGTGLSASSSSSGGGDTSILNVTESRYITESEKNAVSFIDLDTVEWAKNSIETLYKSGVVSGRNDGTFDPLAYVTRAEFCKMAVIAFGLIDDSMTIDFNDVSDEAWYSKYILIAATAGIIKGENGSFRPNEAITREDLAVISLRILDNKGINAVKGPETYDDLDEISEYAYDAVLSLNGIMNGVGSNKFAPKQAVSRAMAAVVINRLMER